MNRDAYRVGLVTMFLAMGNVILVKSWADAAFLAAHGSARLPHFIVAQTAAFVAASAIYGALSRRMPAVVIDAVTVAALGILALVAPLARSGGAIFAMTVVMVALSSIANLAAWNAVAATVGGRLVRRYLPLAGAAATAGAVAAGAFGAALATRAGVDTLPHVAAGLCVALLAGGIEVARRTAGGARHAGPAAPALGTVRREGMSAQAGRLVAWLAAAAVAEAAAGAIMEFQFKSELRSQYGRNEIGAFIAAYYGVTNAGVLVLQLVAVPRLLATRSLAFAGSFHPAALLLVFSAGIAVPMLAVAAFGRTLDAVLKFSMSRATQEVALAPLPAGDQARWKILLRGGATQIGAAAAGLALIVAAPAARRAPWAVMLLGALLAAGWLLSVRRVARAYLASLAAALGLRRLALDAERVTDTGLDREGFRELVERAGDPDPRVARFGQALVLRVCRRAGELVPHLGHPAPAVRAALYDVAARRPDRAALPALRAAVLAETDDAALAAGLEALAAHGDPAGEARARALTAPAGRRYLAALGRLPAAESWDVACATLDADGPRAAAILRREIAAGRCDRARLEAEIDVRMDSPDPARRREAYRAAAALAGELPRARLLDALESGDAGAQAAIAEAPGSALLVLCALARQRRGGGRTRARLCRALGSSEAAEAGRLLVELLGDAEPAVREAAARTLARRARDRGESVPPKVVDRALERELDLLQAYVEARAPLGARPAFHDEELERQAAAALDRVLAVASLSGDPATVHAAARRLRSGRPEDRRGALDLLQEVARGERRRRLLELVERLLDRPAAPPPPEAVGRLSTQDPWLSRVLGGRLEAERPRLEALRRTPLFAAVPGEALAALAASAVEELAPRGAVIVREGEPGDAMFVLEAGRLRLLRDGRPLGELAPGACFGELALIDGAPRTATVEAAEGEARLLRLPRVAFQEALERSPEMGLGLLSSLARWLRGGPAASSAPVPDAKMAAGEEA